MLPAQDGGFKLTDHGDSAVITQGKPHVDPDLVKLRELLEDGPHSKTNIRKGFGIEKANSMDKDYQAWARKWKSWTAAGKAILVEDVDAGGWDIAELAR